MKLNAYTDPTYSVGWSSIVYPIVKCVRVEQSRVWVSARQCGLWMFCIHGASVYFGPQLDANTRNRRFRNFTYFHNTVGVSGCCAVRNTNSSTSTVQVISVVNLQLAWGVAEPESRLADAQRLSLIATFNLWFQNCSLLHNAHIFPIFHPEFVYLTSEVITELDEYIRTRIIWI